MKTAEQLLAADGRSLTPIEKRDLAILAMLDRGDTTRNIAHVLKCRRSLVSDWKYGRTVNHQRGRPASLYNFAVEDFAEANWAINARITDSQMARMINEEYGLTYDRTRACRLRNHLGYKYRPPFHIQHLTSEQRIQRMLFCREMITNLDLARAEQKEVIIIFSDESRFCMGPDNSWVRVKRGEWNSTATVDTVKFPMGVMVWGCIGPGLKPDLVVMSHHVNAAEYQQAVLQSGMIELANAKYGAGNFFFMQDGASMHLCEETLAVFHGHFLILPGWPPNSPDLNPIEMLWAIVGHRLAGRTFATEAELIAAIHGVWAQIAPEAIDGLVYSFRDRLELCVKVNAASISQLLSSHIKTPRAQDIAEATTVRAFTPEVDGAIIDYVDQRGRKWTQMYRDAATPEFVTLAPILELPPAAAPLILKNRWLQLEIKERNRDFVSYSLGHYFALLHPEIIALFPPRDAAAEDDAAHRAVEDEEPVEDEDSGSPEDSDDKPLPDNRDDKREPLMGVVPAVPTPLGKSPWLIFADDKRIVVKRANPGLAAAKISALLGQMWQALSPVERGEYESRAALPVRPIGRGKGATGRPKK